MSTIIEEIKKVVNKIDENYSKKSLDEDEVKQLLADVDDGLIKVKKSAEGNQAIDEKVKEFRSKIDKAINDELGWGRAKMILDSIKKNLEELEKELEKPQKKQISSQQFAEVDSNKVAELEKIIKEKDERIEKLKKEIGARDAFLELLDKKIEGISDKNEKLNINKVVNQAKTNWLEGFKVAVDSTDAGAGIISRPAAGLLAGGAAGIASAVHIGVYGIEKSADNVMEVYENTRKGAQAFSELIAKNTTDVFKEGIKDATEVATSFNTGLFSIFNKKEIIESLEAKNEMLEQQLKEKGEEFKQRLENREERIKEKNVEIKELQERNDKQIKELQERNDKEIERMQKRIDQLENKQTAQVEQYN